MSDRTSAAIFGDVFKFLASIPQTPERDRFVQYMWEQCREYDFSDYQLCADEVLIGLGLAHRGPDPEFPDDDVIFYHR